jgi:alkaline phosphatase D
MKIFILFLLATAFSHSKTNQERLQEISELRRIAFGSCNYQYSYQPLWEDLLGQKPDLWIWGGDSIYADWKDPEDVLQAFQTQNAHPQYSQFKEQTPIIGTWDDHDFGYDNASGMYLYKKESQQLFLDFLDEPKGSLRRQQDGIYTSYDFGEANKKIKIIILDNRFFKDLDWDYPMLGKEQWNWLEEQLTNSDAKIHFIVTGLSVFSPLIPITEEWAETVELDNMLKLLKKTKAQGVVFLTGDKHFSSIFQRWGQLEFMSSGMTHQAPRKTWWYLARRYPVTYFGLSYGQIDIDWVDAIPVLTMSMRNEYGQDIHRQKYIWQHTKWQRSID